MIVEVAVKYEGEAYVAEGGECGTTLELAKIYNTLGSFYQEQVRGWKWGEWGGYVLYSAACIKFWCIGVRVGVSN